MSGSFGGGFGVKQDAGALIFIGPVSLETFARTGFRRKRVIAFQNTISAAKDGRRQTGTIIRRSCRGKAAAYRRSVVRPCVRNGTDISIFDKCAYKLFISLCVYWIHLSSS